MLRSAIALLIACLLAGTALVALSVVLFRVPVRLSSASIDPAVPADTYSFLGGNAIVRLPKASRDVLVLDSARTSLLIPGVFTGNFYGAFETSWFQSELENRIWTLMGEDDANLWKYYETDLVVAYGPDHPKFDPNSSRPLEDYFWPFVCVRTTFEGRQDWTRDVVYVDRVLSAKVINLPVDQCIPASAPLTKKAVPLGPSRSPDA